jgi:xylose isomerase
MPNIEPKLSIGLWCTAFTGTEVFGSATRPPLDPFENLRLIARAGAWGFNFHDDDLVPFGSSPVETDRILDETRRIMDGEGLVASMATTNMFSHPIFKDGALTSADARVRAYARQKAMRAADMGDALGCSVFVMWGGREGLEVEASRDSVEALRWYREGVEFIAGYLADRGSPMRIAMEPKPSEPRGDIYLPTAGSVLGFIATLDEAVRDRVGVNPEVQHARMVNLDFVHEVAQCLDAGKLYHIDLGAQKPGRFDQDLRFGAEDLKETFFLVKLLDDARWDGPHAFDVKPYRSDTRDDLEDLVSGCIRTYRLLLERVDEFRADAEIQELLAACRVDDAGFDATAYSRGTADRLRGEVIDVDALAARRLPYQRLDQAVVELLLGVRR